MMPFHRAPQPGFWAVKQNEWLVRLRAGTQDKIDPLQWHYEKKRLTAWFHDEVRQRTEGAPTAALCAYCDGALGLTSRTTIDHFFPARAFPVLALCWENLYPACDRCNSEFKRAQWSCHFIRPDADPVEQLFDFDPVTGKLRPAPEALRRTRARVRLTIRLFRLNSPERCSSRALMWKSLENAWKHPPDSDLLGYFAHQGPYRMVVRQFLNGVAALPTPDASRCPEARR